VAWGIAAIAPHRLYRLATEGLMNFVAPTVSGF